LILITTPTGNTSGAVRATVEASSATHRKLLLRAAVAGSHRPRGRVLWADALGQIVRYAPAEAEAWGQQIQGHGLSAAMTQALVEMFEDIADGRDMGGMPLRPLPCTTTLEVWARALLAPIVRSIRAA
jgi:hypothetical protein